jgi:hypothetical protein
MPKTSQVRWGKTVPLEESLKLLQRGHGAPRSPEATARRRVNWVRDVPDDFASNTMGGLVYFIDCQDVTKIGFTAKPVHERIEAWACGNPFDLTIFAFMPGKIADEHAMKAKYKLLRHKGEWFRLGDKERQEIAEAVTAAGGIVVRKG